MAKRSDGIKKVDDIDEKEFLSILDGRATPSALPQKKEIAEIKEEPEVTTEEKNEEEPILPARQEISDEQRTVKPLSKRKQGEIYESKFLQPRELKIRQCVYISRSVHETIADIVKRIGERGLTVGVYIDTILQQHLQENKEEINALYCKPTDKIIK
ncbi:DUF3408 domain-containing protein [Bacteroides sp. 519]|uniref:DUF3408 domain-containing protein n=1 Tax=Bacteroides sp. 519 TaxID=2302937 RepID=UPI0013D6AC0C|nr:DUF3408 domain-containing protein [Bacteroides sp. 519]NDV57960.1 DUF3408 domain-containing protein [Bacteroides sp. 519]